MSTCCSGHTRRPTGPCAHRYAHAYCAVVQLGHHSVWGRRRFGMEGIILLSDHGHEDLLLSTRLAWYTHCLQAAERTTAGHQEGTQPTPCGIIALSEIAKQSTASMQMNESAVSGTGRSQAAQVGQHDALWACTSRCTHAAALACVAVPDERLADCPTSGQSITSWARLDLEFLHTWPAAQNLDAGQRDPLGR